MDANDLELSPSDSSETLDAAHLSANAGVDAVAESSTADGDTDEGALSIVRDVVNQKEQASEAASPAEGSETGDALDDEQPKKEQDNENYSDVPFHKHPRFQQLLTQKKEFERDAVQFRNVQMFLDNNGLGAEEAADGLIIMAMMKTNPAAAWERMKPVVQKLLVAAGEVLPDDLVQRVQAGEMSREAAYDVSRSRAQVESMRFSQSFQEQQAERQHQQMLSNNLVATAESWLADRRIKDPNFAAKEALLEKELVYLQAKERRPSTPEGVRDQLKRAYAAVVLPASAPAAPQRHRPPARPASGGQVIGNAQPAPESTLDIIRQLRNGS